MSLAAGSWGVKTATMAETRETALKANTLTLHVPPTHATLETTDKTIKGVNFKAKQEVDRTTSCGDMAI